MKTYRPLRRLISLESLENRMVLAGSVAGSVLDGVLTLSGDAEANNVVFSSGESAGEIVVRGATTGDAAAPTLVNGELGPVTFSGVTDVTLDLLGGNDQVLLTDLNLAGDVTGNLGAGRDSLTLSSDASAMSDVTLNDGATLATGEVSIGGDVLVSGGAGRDTLELADAAITGAVDFLGGAGDDQVIANGELATNVVDGDVTIDLGAGDATVDLTNLDIGGTLIVNGEEATAGVEVMLENVKVGGDLNLMLSDFADVVVIAGSSGMGNRVEVVGDVSIDTGAGSDDISLRRLTAANVSVDAGAGADAVDLRGLEVTGMLDVATGRGADEVMLRNIEATTLRLLTGGGDDEVAVRLQNVNAVNGIIRTGRGDDQLELTDAVFSNLTLGLGAGDDRAVLENVTVEQLLRVNGGAGDDRLDLDQVEARRAVLDLGAGKDKVDVIDSIFNRLNVTLGEGKDHISFRGTTVENLFEIDRDREDKVKDKGGNEIPGLNQRQDDDEDDDDDDRDDRDDDDREDD